MTADNESTLKAINVTKIFPHPFKEETNIPIFAGATFDMLSSQLNFLVGASGSGKTTLLRIILGIEAINAGEIYFNDLPIYRLKGKEKISFFKNVGYLDQFPAKFLSLHFSIKKNLDYALALHLDLPKEERIKRIQEVTRNFGLYKLLDERTIHLSGGELRRLSLACNIIFEPTILLCDEPTSQLDDISKQLVMNTIIKLHEENNFMILIATHDHSIIREYPKYEIKNGKVSRCQ